MSTTYDVTVTREGKWWMVHVPALGELTQARRLAEVELMARELIAVTMDVKLSDVAVSIGAETVGDTDIIERVCRIQQAKAAAADLESTAMAESRSLAKDLAGQGVPVRDIGEALGVSYQRAHQLVSGQA